MRKTFLFLYSFFLLLYVFTAPVLAQTAVPGEPCPGGQCATGLGFSISTEPGALITSLFGILLSLSGGIAIILIIVSGYQLVASQGNAEKVEAARNTLTSAVTGLLFLILSFVILEIIGFNILQIPSFH